MQNTGLKRAHELQAKAAAVGFDWPFPADMLDKLHEELDELQQALQPGMPAAAASEELGDLLFVLVNLARRLGLDPDAVLQGACDKFERRFDHVRAALARQGKSPEQAGLDAMEALWEEAKRLERRR
jgi:ATP diphosphatase